MNTAAAGTLPETVGPKARGTRFLQPKHMSIGLSGEVTDFRKPLSPAWMSQLRFSQWLLHPCKHCRGVHTAHLFLEERARVGSSQMLSSVPESSSEAWCLASVMCLSSETSFSFTVASYTDAQVRRITSQIYRRLRKIENFK